MLAESVDGARGDFPSGSGRSFFGLRVGRAGAIAVARERRPGARGRAMVPAPSEPVQSARPDKRATCDGLSEFPWKPLQYHVCKCVSR